MESDTMTFETFEEVQAAIEAEVRTGEQLCSEIIAPAGAGRARATGRAGRGPPSRDGSTASTRRCSRRPADRFEFEIPFVVAALTRCRHRGGGLRQGEMARSTSRRHAPRHGEAGRVPRQQPVLNAQVTEHTATLATLTTERRVEGRTTRSPPNATSTWPDPRP